jgi:hypothetical protein
MEHKRSLGKTFEVFAQVLLQNGDISDSTVVPSKVCPARSNFGNLQFSKTNKHATAPL